MTSAKPRTALVVDPTHGHDWRINHINVNVVKRNTDCCHTDVVSTVAYKIYENICENLCETGIVHINPVRFGDKAFVEEILITDLQDFWQPPA